MANEKEARINLQELSKKINKYGKHQKNESDNYIDSEYQLALKSNYIGEFFERFEEYGLSIYDTIISLDSMIRYYGKSWIYRVSDNTNQLQNYLTMLEKSMENLNDDEKYYISFIIIRYYTYWKLAINEREGVQNKDAEQYFYYFIDIVFNRLIENKYIDNEYLEVFYLFMKLNCDSDVLINSYVRTLMIKSLEDKKIDIPVKDDENLKILIQLKKYLKLKKKEIKDPTYLENLNKLSKLGKYSDSLDELPYEIFKNKHDAVLLNLFLFKINNKLKGDRYRSFSDKRFHELQNIIKLLNEYIETEYSFEEYLKLLNDFSAIKYNYELDRYVEYPVVNKKLKFKSYDSLFDTFFSILYDSYKYDVSNEKETTVNILKAVVKITETIDIEGKDSLNKKFENFICKIEREDNNVEKNYLDGLMIFSYYVFDNLSSENKERLLNYLLFSEILSKFDLETFASQCVSLLLKKGISIEDESSIFENVDVYTNKTSAFIMLFYKYFIDSKYNETIKTYTIGTLFFHILIATMVSGNFYLDEDVFQSFIDSLSFENYNSISNRNMSILFIFQKLIEKDSIRMDFLISKNIEKIESLFFQKGHYGDFLVLILELPKSRKKIRITDSDYFSLLKDYLSFSNVDINTMDFILHHEDKLKLNDYFKNNNKFKSELIKYSLLDLNNNYEKYSFSSIFEILKDIEEASSDKEKDFYSFMDILIEKSCTNGPLLDESKIDSINKVIVNGNLQSDISRDIPFSIISYMYEKNIIDIEMYMYSVRKIAERKTEYE